MSTLDDQMVTEVHREELHEVVRAARKRGQSLKLCPVHSLQQAVAELGVRGITTTAAEKAVVGIATLAIFAVAAGVAWSSWLNASLPLKFAEGQVWLGEEQVTDDIRSEQTGSEASKIAALPALRRALLSRQRAFRQAPGLVADGRDMGSVVFPDAGLKIFLTASVEARAERRTKQLIQKGNNVILGDILRDLQVRDSRDSSRVTAPLRSSASRG